jgi:hypothetical protein
MVMKNWADFAPSASACLETHAISAGTLTDYSYDYQPTPPTGADDGIPFAVKYGIWHNF